MEFENIISRFLSADDAVRRSAEDVIKSKRENPDALVTGFIEAIIRSQSVEIRQTGAVLLRKLFVGDNPLYEDISEGVHLSLREALLGRMTEEPESVVRKAVLELVSLLASVSFAEKGINSWPTFMQFLNSSINDAKAENQVSGFTLFERLGNNVADHMTEHLSSLVSIFLARFADTSAPFEVRAAAGKAVVSILIYVRTVEEPKFKNVLPCLLQVLTSAAAPSSDEEFGKTVSGVILELACTKSHLFKSMATDIINLLCQISSTKQVVHEIRLNCIEILVSLSEGIQPTLRKLPGNPNPYLSGVLPVCFGLLSEYGEGFEFDEKEWESRNYDTDDMEYEGRLVEVGEEAFQRISASFSPKKFVPAFLSYVSQFVGSPDEGMRIAGLSALSYCAETSFEDVRALSAVGEKVCQLARSDPSARVRRAALQALCSLCSGQAGVFQRELHAIMVPLCSNSLLADPSRRVRVSAAQGLIAYAEPLDAQNDEDIVSPYLSGVMSSLSQCLSSPAAAADPALQSVVMSATSVLCGVAGEAVSQFAPVLLGGLNGLLSQPLPPGRVNPDISDKLQDPVYHARLMKGKALECMTIIGVSIGGAHFRDEGLKCLAGICGLLEGTGHEGASEDPVSSYVWDAIGRLVTILPARDCAPFLPHLLPPLLAAARDSRWLLSASSIDTNDIVQDDDDDDEAEEGQDQFLDGNGQLLRVRTAELEDKQCALDALVNLFHHLGAREDDREGMAALAPYARSFIEALLTTLNTLTGPHLVDIRNSCLVGLEDAFAVAVSCTPLSHVLAAQQCLAQITATLGNTSALPFEEVDRLLDGLGCPLILPFESGAPLELPASLQGAEFLVAACVLAVRVMAALIGGDEDAEATQTALLAVCQLLTAVCKPRAYIQDVPETALPPAVSVTQPLVPGEEPVAYGQLPLLPVPILERLNHLILALHVGALQRTALREAEAKLAAEPSHPGQAVRDEEDDEDLENAAHVDANLCTHALDTAGKLLATHGRSYLPIFASKIAPLIEEWTAPGCEGRIERRSAFFVMTDVLEYLGDAASLVALPAPLDAASLPQFVVQQGAPCGPRYLSRIVNELLRQDINSLQCCAYAIGAAARAAPETFRPFVQPCVRALGTVLTSFASKKEKEFSSCLDNCAAAIGVILTLYVPPSMSQINENISRAMALQILLARAPLVHDASENANVMRMCARWINERDKDFLANTNGAFLGLQTAIKSVGVSARAGGSLLSLITVAEKRALLELAKALKSIRLEMGAAFEPLLSAAKLSKKELTAFEGVLRSL